MQNVIDIKTNVDTKQAIKNIQDFSKQLDNFNTNAVKKNKDNINSFDDFGTAIQDMLSKANEMLNDFQSQVNDFDTDNFNSNIETSDDKITALSQALKSLMNANDDVKDSIDNTTKDFNELGNEAKDTVKSVDKLDDKLDDLDKSSKGTSLALEALKDKLGEIPVIGQTLSRALDDVDGSFKSVVLAAAPVAGIAVGFTAVAGVLYGAYKNSEDLRKSISNIGETSKTSFVFFNDTLEDIGNAIAGIINKFDEWQKKVNALSGASAKYSIDLANETIKNLQAISENADKELTILDELGGDIEYKTQERNRILQESTQELVDTSKQGYSDLSKALTQASIDVETSFNRMQEAKKQYDEYGDVYNYSGLNIYLSALQRAEGIYNENVKAETALREAVETTRQTYIDSTKALTELNKEQEKSGDTKIELTPHQELEKLLKSIIVETENYVDLVESSSATEIEKTELIKNARLNALQSQKQALTDFAKIQGYDYDKDIEGVADLNTETGELIKTTSKLAKGYDDVDKAIKSLGTNSKKTFNDMQGSIMSILSSISSITDSLISGIGTVLTSGVEDYTAYNQAIIDAQNELNEYLAEIEEEEAESDDEDYNLKMERLQEELEKAIEAQDAMAENAIRDKMKELEAERKKTQEENKLAKEQEETEKKLQNAIAQAEYQKELAVWNNQVKNAETQKNLTIAQAVAQSAFGIAMASVGTATSFAQGGLVGLTAGLVAAASIVGAIGGAVSSIYSAVQQYENVKANPPTAPQGFAIGTAGYTLSKGESAIVGELGAERVSNMGDGRIAVDTARVTEYAGYNKGGDIVNIYVTITGYINDRETLINELLNIKQSELETVR